MTDLLLFHHAHSQSGTHAHSYLMQLTTGTDVRVGDSSQATIVVERAPGGMQDRLRAYSILVDGNEEAQLRRGEKVEITVEPGSHVLVAQIDWIKTDPQQVQLRPGEIEEFLVKSAREHWSGLRYLFTSNWKWIALESKNTH